MNEKPKVFTAILLAILGFFSFALSYLLSYFVLGGIVYGLSKIPLLGKLFDFIFFLRGDSPDLMLSLLCPGIAYMATIAILNALTKSNSTMGLSCIIIGVCIMLLQAIALVINLVYGEGIWKNIVLIIAGFMLLSSGSGNIKEE